MKKLTVELKDDPRLKVVTKDKRGPIVPNRDAEYLPRRLSGVYVNFWDLGLKWNGSEYVDLDYWAIHHGSPYPGNDVNSVDWPALEDQIFLVDEADWETIYKKIEHGSAARYGLDVVLNDDTRYLVAETGSRAAVNSFPPIANEVANAWTPQGLKVPEGSALSQIVSGMFGSPRFFSSIISSYATESHDPGAPQVTLPPLENGTKVFLMPRLCSLFCDSPSDAVGVTSTAYFGVRTIPREFFLQDSVFSTLMPMQQMFHTDWWYGGSADIITLADEHSIVDYFKANPLTAQGEVWNTVTSTMIGNVDIFPNNSTYDLYFVARGAPHDLTTVIKYPDGRKFYVFAEFLAGTSINAVHIDGFNIAA